MDFYEVVRQVLKLLEQQGRVTSRGLKLQFKLDDETLEALKEEILYSRPQVVDDEGRGLIWNSGTEGTLKPASQSDLTPQSEPQPVIEQVEPTPVEPTVEPHTPDAERRQLTVMFCDLVGSTSLSGEMDPEDLREVIQAYQAACTGVIQRYDGHVAQLLGDGLLAYFGYPVAHEDDAQRSVHAGLGILNAIENLNTRLEQDNKIKLAVRLGIHTGLVVVGEMGGEGRQEQLALGEAPNVAARIQGLAEPDTLIISDATYRMIQGYFDCDALGEHDLRGVSQPMPVYQVLQESGARNRLDVVSPRGLTPLFGRNSELQLLVDRWNQVQSGEGQVVLLNAEPGLGKSRMVQALREHLVDETYTRLECRSSPYYQNTALYPVIDLVQRTLGWEQNDSSDEKLDKLGQALSQYRLPVAETVSLIAGLLSLSLPEDRYPALNLTPQRQRQKILETIAAMLLELAEKQPVLFVVEDLHWTDPSTLELLDLLIDQVPTASEVIEEFRYSAWSPVSLGSQSEKSTFI